MFFGRSFAVIRLTRRATLVAWSSPLSCLINYFLSCHLRSIAFSSQQKHLDILNTSFSKRNMMDLFHCHCLCHCQGQTMWVCRGDYRGDSSAASVVIESPFVGFFGQFRGTAGEGGSPSPESQTFITLYIYIPPSNIQQSNIIECPKSLLGNFDVNCR